MPDAPTPGSIADTLARLRLWCQRSDHGFIRVIFDDGRARDAVIAQLPAALGPDTPFRRLDLPVAATPDLLAERLIDELARLGPGVISITGFEASLPTGGPALDGALRALNSRRENFARPGQHTVWWFPRHVALSLSAGHHDLNSWFLKRAELTETLASPAERAINDQWLEANRLHTAAKYQESETLFRQILAHEEKNLGPDHPRFATALSNLALLLQDTNRLAEAEPLMRRSLAINEASFGHDHPAVARDLNNLAQLLQATNRLADAEPLMRRALVIDETSFGPDHPTVAVRLNNLAGLLQDTNRLAEAEPLMRRALAMDEASFGPDHPEVARDLNNLAALLQATNRRADAEPLMQRALAIIEASFGPEHPNVATALNNFAQLLQDTKRLTDAEPLMRRALTIVEASFGPEHPDVAINLNNLAQLLQTTNRMAEAEPLMRRALAIDEASFGPNHPNVAIRLNNLARLLQATKRLVEAEPPMRRHLEIFVNFTRATGHPHPYLKAAANNYKRLLTEMGDTPEQAQTKVDQILGDVRV